MWQCHRTSRAYGLLVIQDRCMQCFQKVIGGKHKFVLCLSGGCLKGWIINRKSGKEGMDRDGIVSLSADYSTEDRLTRNSWSTASLSGKWGGYDHKWTCSVGENNIQKDGFRRRWKSQYLGSCGGPACPVMMNSMGFPLRWLYSIRTDTGFFPPGRERDSGWRGPSVIPIPSTLPLPQIPPMPSAGPWWTVTETQIYFN